MADKLSNTGIGTPDAEIAAACLTEYMQGFQKRNPLTVEQYKEYANEIETGKPIFAGKVTLFKEDYGDVTDLARKQIATESKESELSAEIIRLKKDNEQAAIQIADQKQEILRLYPLKQELRKVKNELSSLKLRFQKVLDFVESMRLAQKLQEFLKPFTKRYQM